MRFMLLIYLDEKSLTKAEYEECYGKSVALAQDLQASGKFLATAPLQPSDGARTVRIREGQRILTDGPFAETREQLGGYFLVDAENYDEAVEIAARIPGAQFGTVEVRQVTEIGDRFDVPADTA
jgi:hypothetical protein